MNVKRKRSAAGARAGGGSASPGVTISQVSHIAVDGQDVASLGIDAYGEQPSFPGLPSPVLEDADNVRKDGGRSEMDVKGNGNEKQDLESGLDLGRGTENESSPRVAVLKRERSVIERGVGTRGESVIDMWEMVPLPSRPVPTLKVSAAEQQGSGSMTSERQRGERMLKRSLTIPWDGQSEEMMLEQLMHPLILNYVSGFTLRHTHCILGVGLLTEIALSFSF